MAGRALAAFFLLVTLLQVRAQVDCYTDDTCAVGDASKYVASTARNCCLDGLPATRGYSTVGDRSDCTVCLVIGFSQTNLTLDEETEQIRIVRVKALTSVSSELGNSDLDFNIQVTPSGSSAALGSDLKVNDGSEATIPYSTTLSQLDEELKLQTLNDTNTGEIEHFVLEVTGLLLSPQEVAPIPVFAGPSLLVTIIDDDIIHVEFEVTEYQLNEDQENLTITFKINKRIPAATHFILRPMRYKEYDDKYPELLKKYPNLKPYSLNDEYDQAELEDFNSTAIPFTIPRNATEPDRQVVIRVYDDDLLEPAEEGFRLVLEVDESKTRLSEVTFGRQIALFRIDNTDKIKFGFQDDALTLIDMAGTRDYGLPLRVVSGETEFPIDLSFAIGDRTNATVGVDFADFSESARVIIDHPKNFNPEPYATVTVHGDDIYEGDELIQVIIEYELDLPEPFKPKHADDSTEYGSVVDPPPTGSVELELRNTLIVIKEGLENNSAVLHVPKVVREGGRFTPNITVLHIVNATFRVYNPFGQGTATKGTDYSFTNQNVEFGPTRTWNVTSSEVSIATDDLLEPDETFEVEFYASAPPGISQVMILSNPNKTVTIIDENNATIGFETPPEESLYENEGPAILNVTVKGDRLASNAQVVVRFYTSPGTAQIGSDFVAVNKQLTFTGAQQRIVVEIPIVDDTMFEPEEMFEAHLEFVSSNANNVVVEPTPATVTIEDDDPPAVKYCTLSSSLILNTFSNQLQMGRDINISMGCERKLVTSCDPNVDLEIRVDFFKDNFVSTKVAIFYEGEEVIMDESLNLTPATSPSNDLLFSTGMMSVSVSIPDIGLTVTLNSTQLTIATDNDALNLAGLCGNITGELVYPDCTDIVGSGEPLDEFIHSFKVKPSDQVLRDERKECGITTNDTIISDPLMTVPIHAPGFPSDLNLCYEIHGAADKYFNLVSDECTSVNAYYASAASDSELNIIQSISVVAVDNAGKCHNITIDASSCNDEGKRRRRAPRNAVEENGVSVRYYDSRVRISVPNCEDNELVMWVVCQNQSLYDYDRNTTIKGVEMIKFEIARGLNLKETSHGLLGQFWNIPITVTEYSGPFVYTVDPADKYYTVEVHYPMSPVRRFVGYMFDVTWEWKHKHCVYAGDRQGGPAGEVASDGSVIEGTYKDYVISNRFGTQFKYGVFVEGACL